MSHFNVPVSNSSHMNEVLSLIKVNNKGWRSKLFKDENRIRAYLCDDCGSVCCDAVELGCNHNEQDICLYCNQCLNQLIHENSGKCPINSHDDPVIIASRAVRRQILKSMVLCPYSMQYKQKNNGQTDETVCGDEKEGVSTGCDWNGGSLHDLNTKHLSKCVTTFNPLFCQNMTIKKLENENDELTKQLNVSLENNKKLTQQIEELQNELSEEFVTKMNEENKFNDNESQQSKEEINKLNEETSWKERFSFMSDSKYRWFLCENNEEKKENGCNKEIQCVKILKENPNSIQFLNGEIISNISSDLLFTTPPINNICEMIDAFNKNIQFLFCAEPFKERFEFDVYCKEYCKVLENGTRCVSVGNVYNDICFVSSIGWKEGIHEWSIKFTKCNPNYTNIGLVSNYKPAVKAHVHMHSLGSYAYFDVDGEIKVNGWTRSRSFCKWKSGDIIRVRLDCNFWTVYFWKNDEFVFNAELRDKNKIYYPAVQIKTWKSGDNDFRLL